MKYLSRLGLIVLAIVSLAAFAAAGCGGETQSDQERQVNQQAKKQKAYIPKNGVELDNYNKAQELYDSPDTIIWCSTTWGNPSSPIVTVPITGKLTSSSTTFFRPEDVVNGPGDGAESVVSKRSVDGLYHPNPPQYRYGFTPGGQYVDFYNMPTVCTTSLSKFQRQKTELTVQVDQEGLEATRNAEALLKKGDAKGAQEALKGLEGQG